jgi:hypothetical protein
MVRDTPPAGVAAAPSGVHRVVDVAVERADERLRWSGSDTSIAGWPPDVLTRALAAFFSLGEALRRALSAARISAALAIGVLLSVLTAPVTNST